MLPQKKKRLVIGISGASGAPIAVKLLNSLKCLPDWESHLVVSQEAKRTIKLETPYSYDEVLAFADKTYEVEDIAASIASGTFQTEGMIVVPCSMKTLAGIASGFSDNLLLRTADVAIKESRKLILIVRESPFSAVHLKNMLELARLGVIIMPAMMSFYNSPHTIEDMIQSVVGKALDRFGIEIEEFKRWGEQNGQL